MRSLLAVAIIVLSSCQSKPSGLPARRADLRTVGKNLVELVPRPGAPPYCLAFTVAETGVIRQLTMNEQNRSISCEADKAVGGAPFRIPEREGKARIYVFFSYQELKAGSIAEQMNEMAGKPGFSVLDMRLPGQVLSDVLEFAPE